MTQPVILDGTATSKRLLADLKDRVERHVANHGTAPGLATVLVGDDPASHTYVKMKMNRSRQVGVTPHLIELSVESTTEDVVAEVERLSSDPQIHGILVQHPAPSQVDEAKVFEAIAPHKDVDGVTSSSLASMVFQGQGFRSATPGGIMRLLESYGIEVAGKQAVVVGRSQILGIPVGLLLLAADATVTYCHSKTSDLSAEVRRADIVIAAAGQPGLIKGDWLKDGAVIVDAGYAENSGDVDFEQALQRASAITPVPGGVGPMTIACLLEQTVDAYERRRA